jgi:glycosyltransferase involved in cell wall biosynthesis
VGPLVSVVIPAFNAERTLQETLESAAAQSWRAIEIIIVDDGSSDRTGEIARQFCSREPRARIVRQSNLGEAGARNKGIAEARGDWIAPLDADDLWHPEKIERQLEAGRRDSRIGLVYCWSRHIDSCGRVTGAAPCSRMQGSVLRDHLQANFIGNGSAPLIRTELLRDLSYNTRLDACADYLLQLELAMRTWFALVPGYLVAYRVTGTNISSDAVRMSAGHIVMYRLLSRQLGSSNRRVAARELARWNVVQGLMLLRRGMLVRGFASLIAGFSRAPGAALFYGWQQVKLRTLRGGRTAAAQGGTRLFGDFEPTEHMSEA